MERHYVITGGGGFLGAHLIAALQQNGDFTKVIVVDPNPRLSHFDTIKLDETRIVYEKDSFLNESVIQRVLPNASTVFHLCAIGHTGRFGAKRHQAYVYAFNVIGTKWLIDRCKAYNVPRFIYSSSIAVVFTGKPIYNCKESVPYPDKREFIDIYSSSKAEAERYIRSQSTEKFKTTCLRFRAIYGPNDATVAEKVVKMMRNNMFRVKVSRHGRESISNMSSGENCGLAFHLANQALIKNTAQHGQVYFITDGENIGQYSVWTPLIRALGKTPPKYSIPYQYMSTVVTILSFIYYEMFCSSPPMTRFELEVLVTDNTYSIEKATKELGFHPGKKHFLKTVEYYRHQHKLQISAKDSYLMNREFLIVVSVMLFLITFCCFMNSA